MAVDIHTGQKMNFAMMRIIMLDVTLMVELAVAMRSKLSFVKNVNALKRKN